MQEYVKRIAGGMLSTFEEYLQGKHVLYRETMPRNRPVSFEASLWEGKLVYNKLEIFWMTIEAII